MKIKMILMAMATGSLVLHSLWGGGCLGFWGDFWGDIFVLQGVD